MITKNSILFHVRYGIEWLHFFSQKRKVKDEKSKDAIKTGKVKIIKTNTETCNE